MNAIGRQLRDSINSGLTRWRMVVISGCMLLLILYKYIYICIHIICAVCRRGVEGVKMCSFVAGPP